MRANIARSGLVAAMVIALSSCGGGGTLNGADTANDGPDEFAVLPGKTLQSPEDFANLPVPTPGQGNLTDPTPKADAVAALGGRRSAVSQSGISTADAALLNYTGRYGVAANIRADLAPRNPDRRQQSGFLGRLFSGLGGQTLNTYQELERLRAAGVQTPSAPPRP